MFSSASDAPRARRPTDIVLLVLADPAHRRPVVRGPGTRCPRYGGRQPRQVPPRPHRMALGDLLRPAVRLDALRAHGVVVRTRTQTPVLRRTTRSSARLSVRGGGRRDRGHGDLRWTPRARLVRTSFRLPGDAPRRCRCRDRRGVSPPVSTAAEYRQAGRHGRGDREHRLGDRPAHRRDRRPRCGLRRRVGGPPALGLAGGQALAAAGREGTRRARDRRDRSAVRAPGTERGLAGPGIRG